MRPGTGSRPSRARFTLLALASALGAAACGERVGGPTDLVGQLSVEPAFTPGNTPAELGVIIERMRIEVRRGGSQVAYADTVLAWDPATVPSWILTLETESDPVDVRMSLLRHADTLYAGARRVMVRTGTVGIAPVEAVEVLFRGAPVEPGPEIASVDVDPATAMLVGPGATAQLVATARDAGGNIVPGATFVWSTSNGGVAGVDPAGLVTAVARGRASVTATAAGITGTAAMAVAELDSVTYPLAEIIITTTGTEASLGTFVVPDHVPELGVELLAEVELSFDAQRDEAFGIGAVEAGVITFIGAAACPVVADDPALGRGWVRVGAFEVPAGERELVARHAKAFACYQPVAGLGGINSVHFWGIRLVYYRVD